MVPRRLLAVHAVVEEVAALGRLGLANAAHSVLLESHMTSRMCQPRISYEPAVAHVRMTNRVQAHQRTSARRARRLLRAIAIVFARSTSTIVVALVVVVFKSGERIAL